MCPSNKRLGSKSSNQVKEHRWYLGLQWPHQLRCTTSTPGVKTSRLQKGCCNGQFKMKVCDFHIYIHTYFFYKWFEVRFEPQPMLNLYIVLLSLTLWQLQFSGLSRRSLIGQLCDFWIVFNGGSVDQSSGGRGLLMCILPKTQSLFPEIFAQNETSLLSTIFQGTC